MYYKVPENRCVTTYQIYTLNEHVDIRINYTSTDQRESSSLRKKHVMDNNNQIINAYRVSLRKSVVPL